MDNNSSVDEKYLIDIPEFLKEPDVKVPFLIDLSLNSGCGNCECWCQDCQSPCQGSSCQSSCQGWCQDCQGASCQSACQGCMSACVGYCQGNCEGGDQACHSCMSACQNCQNYQGQGCGGAACKSSCQNGQYSGCYSCMYSCQCACEHACQDTCQLSCQACEGVPCQTGQSCGQTPAVPVTGLVLSPSTMSLVVGNTGNVLALVQPPNATNQTVYWYTTDFHIASVSNGTVTALAAGQCFVRAYTDDGGFEASCILTVTSSTTVPVSSVGVTPSSAILHVGETQQLTGTVYPWNATNQNITWSTNNAAVATVSSSGLVTTHGVGSCVITATSVDGGHQATANITVLNSITPWNWTTPISSGGNMLSCSVVSGVRYVYVLPASEWGQFLTKINEVRYNRGYSNYSFTMVVSNNDFRATLINEAIYAINDISPLDITPVTTSDSISAQLFADMRDRINALIV